MSSQYWQQWDDLDEMHGKNTCRTDYRDDIDPDIYIDRNIHKEVEEEEWD